MGAHKTERGSPVLHLDVLAVMKFKALFGAPAQLSKLIQTLDKVADTCVVYLTPSHLRFGVISEGKENLNMHVSCDIRQAGAHLHTTQALDIGHVTASLTCSCCVCPQMQETVFLQYSLQSKAENNRISFFVKLENLSRALRSCCSTGTEHIQVIPSNDPHRILWHAQGGLL